MRVLTTVVILLLAAAPVAQARPGDLDRSFANKGRVAYKVWGSGGATVGLMLLDGRRPVLSVNAYRSTFRMPAFLYLTTGGRLARKTPILAPAVGAPLLAAGHSLQPLAPPTPQSPLQAELTRIGSSTPVTLTFPGMDVYEPSAFGFDGAGRTIVAGTLLHGGGFVARFLPSGALDTTYGTGGRVVVGLYEPSLVIQRNGRVIAADELDIVALDPAGQRVPNFANGRLPRPLKNEGRAGTIARGPGGTFLIAGATATRGYVARMRPNGRLDRRFGDGGFLWRPKAFRSASLVSIARDQRGRIVVAGTTFENGGVDTYSAIVLRLTPRGHLDRSFGKRGAKVFRLGVAPRLGISGSNIDNVVIDDRGRIVVSGEVFDDDFEFREDVGNPYPAIARLQG